MIEQPLQYSLIPRELNSRLEFLILCDSFTRVWSEILVDRIKHYVVYDEHREQRAFCASSHFSLSSLVPFLSWLSDFSGTPISGQLQRRWRAAEIHDFLFRDCNVCRGGQDEGKLNAKTGTSLSHLPDTGGYQDRGLRRTPENPMSVSQTCLIKGELTIGLGVRSESLIQRIKRRTNQRPTHAQFYNTRVFFIRLTGLTKPHGVTAI